MWESYYKLCCSQIFRSTWTKFIKESIGFEADPIFFQHVSKLIIEELIKGIFTTSASVTILKMRYHHVIWTTNNTMLFGIQLGM